MSNATVVLITGSNTGIGFETVKALVGDSTQPYHVLLGGRSLEKVKAAITLLKDEFPESKSKLTPLEIDVTSDESIAKAEEEVNSKIGWIDVLVNNAGAAFDSQIIPSQPSTIRSTWNKAYDVNVSGTHLLTYTFMPLLLTSSSPRLIFLTSGLSSLSLASSGRRSASQASPHPPKGWPKPEEPSVAAYRSSKTALNMMMLEWCRILKEDGVKIWAVSPGFLATSLTGSKESMMKNGAGDARLGGVFVKDVVEGKRDEDVGKVVSRDGVQQW